VLVGTPPGVPSRPVIEPPGVPPINAQGFVVADGVPPACVVRSLPLPTAPLPVGDDPWHASVKRWCPSALTRCAPGVWSPPTCASRWASADVSRDISAADECALLSAWCKVDSAWLAAATAGLSLAGVGAGAASPTVRATERTAAGMGTPTA
jgi:hypothetical protein